MSVHFSRLKMLLMVGLTLSEGFLFFSARCNIYISRLCYDVSVRLSVTEVQWHIIANLGFKFRSQFTAVAVHAGAREGIIAGKSGGIILLYASHC